MDFELDNAYFTYCFSKKKLSHFKKNINVFNNEYFVNCTSNTAIENIKFENKEIVIIGLCIDARGEIKDIGQHIIDNYNYIKEIAEFSQRLAGRYVIIYKNSQEIWTFGDATVSMQINYCKSNNDFCMSSIDNITATYFNYKVSDYSLKIRNGGNYSQAMPNDITMFDEIKSLLPNYILNINNGEKTIIDIKYNNNINNIENINKANTLINNITSEYNQRYKIICPLTSGYDSRACFAFLKKHVKDLKCYTFKINKKDKYTGDIKVAMKIANDYNLEYDIIGSDYLDNTTRCLYKHINHKYILELLRKGGNDV